MAGARQGVPDLRIGVPTLEPDPAFITQLANLAAAAGAAGGFAVVRPRPHHLKVALAAASVAAIATGGAWASGTLSGHDTPTEPSGPVNHPTAPLTTPSETPDDPATDGPPTGVRNDSPAPGAQPDGPAGDDSPADDVAPATTGVPDADDDGEGGADEQAEQEADDDGPDGSDTSESTADEYGPGGDDSEDLASDDDTAGDDGSKGPDPSDADD